MRKASQSRGLAGEPHGLGEAQRVMRPVAVKRVASIMGFVGSRMLLQE